MSNINSKLLTRGGEKARVKFATLGCKVNQYETESMEELFKASGYEIAEENHGADLYVINTCTVTNMSDSKSRQMIRRAKKENKNSVVAVVGCYSQVSPEEVGKIEGVDIILGTTNRDKIVDLYEDFLQARSQINIVEDIKTKKDFEPIKIDELSSKTRAFMKIQDGCNQFCSYCIIPYARGPIRSRNSEDIEAEVKRLAEAGFKEIVLTGIHVASYGKDSQADTGLIQMIDKVRSVDGIERVRFSSVEPTMIDKAFMDFLVENDKVCDHFHLSLQSGCDTVLSRMNRKYTRDQYRKIVDLIKEYMPRAGITTDIIVGFPGETDEEFKETYDFVKEIGFSRIHVFKYSIRKGTPAAEMNDQVDGNVKNIRSEKLIDLGNQLEIDFNSKFIGEELEVLIEEKSSSSDHLEGYTSNYMRVKIDYRPEYIGRLMKVKIEGQEANYLIGSVV